MYNNLMISKYKNNGLVWIDLTSPQKEEVVYVLDEYQIPENIRQEISNPSKEQSTFIENDTLYSIVRLPHPDLKEDENKVIFIKNQNFVITIHDQPINSIEQFSSELELDMLIESESKIRNQELLFANLIRKMLTGLHDKILSKDMSLNSLKRKLSKLQKRFWVSISLNLILIILSILTIIL